MTFKMMFERVNLVTPLEQRRFFDYYDASVNELRMMFKSKYVLKKDCTYATPDDLNYTDVTREFFHEPIIQNILYMAGMGEQYKSEFIRLANLGYKEAWNEEAEEYKISRENGAGGIIKRAGW